MVQPSTIRYGIFEDTEGLRGTDSTTVSMPVRCHSSTARCCTPSRSRLALATVHHYISDIEVHVAALRRLIRYRVVCRSQEMASGDTAAGHVAAVLWELAPRRRPNWRCLRILVHGMSVVSYSSDSTSTVVDRFSEVGCTAHLTAPLHTLDISHNIAIAWTLVVALDHAIRLQCAQALTVTDDLTKFFRSRYLFEVLRSKNKRPVRTKKSSLCSSSLSPGSRKLPKFTAMFFGNLVRVEVGAVIRSCSRETDVVWRFGGDEFVMVLSDTAGEGAMVVVGSVRARIAMQRLSRGRGIQFATDRLDRCRDVTWRSPAGRKFTTGGRCHDVLGQDPWELRH
jgi:GGDEF domain-containing protein